MQFTKENLGEVFSLRKRQDSIRRETTEDSTNEFIQFPVLQHEQITAVSHSRGINQENCVRIFRCLDWLFRYRQLVVQVSAVGCLDIGSWLSRYRHLRLEQLKDMGGVLRKWTPREKHLKYQKFSISFRWHYSWNVLAKFDENQSNLINLINSLKVDVFPQRSNAKF